MLLMIPPTVTFMYLPQIVDKNLEKRKSEIPKVLSIIEEETKNFFQWYRSLKITPIIKGLQEKNRRY
ncbi:MAG TPA: hypothetical protein EYP53_05010 [Candidatus Latescibacteria bacterium]|nr:hypothetical protein [Candidatus Latescibacterota bacterium]